MAGVAFEGKETVLSEVGSRQREVDIQVGDPVALEFGRIMAWGAVIGVSTSVVVATLLARFAGLSWWTALLTSMWPAVVGGPFFGVTFGLVGRFSRMEDHQPPRPADLKLEESPRTLTPQGQTGAS
jgi:hypothetical protein